MTAAVLLSYRADSGVLRTPGSEDPPQVGRDTWGGAQTGARAHRDTLTLQQGQARHGPGIDTLFHYILSCLYSIQHYQTSHCTSLCVRMHRVSSRCGWKCSLWTCPSLDPQWTFPHANPKGKALTTHLPLTVTVLHLQIDTC